MAEADVVVNGISGFSALAPLIASLKAGKRVALANKESVVCGKALLIEGGPVTTCRRARPPEQGETR